MRAQEELKLPLSGLLGGERPGDLEEEKRREALKRCERLI